MIHRKSHLLLNLFLKLASFVECIVIELLCSFVVKVLLLMFQFEVLVYYWALLLLYQENMEQIGSDLRMRNPVCLYLNLFMRYIQVVFGMDRLSRMMNYFWLMKVRVYFYQCWRVFSLVFSFSIFVSTTISSTISSYCFFIFFSIYLKLSLSRIFEKMK